MARGKKKKELSLEEKLELALVPVEEQPYEVPGNWCWVYQNVVCQLGDGEKRSDEEQPYLEVKYLRGHKEADIKKTGKYIEKGTKIILVDGENSGEVFEVSEEGYMGSTFKTLNISCRINEKYLLYFVDSKRDLLRNNKTGSAIPHLNKKLFFGLEFPLPPLKEQQCIVELIESLFAKLDEAKEKIQFVQNCSDDNFASAIHEALGGNLTEEWRKQNGISRSGWKKDKLGNLGCLERGRSKHRPRNDPRLFGGAYPFIQTGDVAESGVYIEKHKQTLSEFGLAQSRMFPKGTLCITIAANIGDVAILSYDCCFPDSVVGFTPYKDVESKYIYYMMSELQKEIEANAPATAQKNINLKILNDIDITIPSVIEQRKIIAILDDLYDKKRQVKEKTEQIVDVIDRMKKSILAKAFSGKLGTNNLEEESSVVLLEQILEQEDIK